MHAKKKKMLVKNRSFLGLKRRAFTPVLWRKGLVVGLLLSFWMLFTPRGLWHEHGHEEHQVCGKSDVALDNEHGHDFEFKGDCFACDFDLDVAPQPFGFAYRFTPVVYFVCSDYANYFVAQEKVDSDSLRGPPLA